jgi:hypothetical protein
VEVILERLWRAPDVLTAGQLLEQPASRALLPDGCLMPGLELEIMRLVLLGVEVLEGGAELRARLKKELRALTPLHLHEGDGVLIATWPTAQAALEAARLFARSSNTRCALHVGPVMELSTDGERVPMGRTVDELLQVLRYASPGIPALLASGLQDREFKEVVSSEAASLQPSELVAEDLPVMLGLRYG